MTAHTLIPGKDAPLEDSIVRMQGLLAELGFDIEEASWLNPVPNCWSVHIRDRHSPLCFTNGKGASRNAALASALGEYFERLATNYFYADYYLGQHAAGDFVHDPRERWFPASDDGLPDGLLADGQLRAFYDPDGELSGAGLVDLNSSAAERGVCALPYERVSDGETLWFPVNLIGNIYVSNGMSAGNTVTEARTQALSEILERHVKFRILEESICLPAIPRELLARWPGIQASVEAIEAAGFSLMLRDASLGGEFPVINVTLLNPEDGSCFASFGAHPRFEVALERTVTELLQGRSLESMKGFAEPSLDREEVADPHNLETHFIDSSGLIAWDFFADDPDFEFVDWNFEGTTEAEYAELVRVIHEQGQQIYISDQHHLGVYGCRILVPGMSEIYPVDELSWRNNNSAVPLRPLLSNLPGLSDEQRAALAEELEQLGQDDAQPVAELLGMAVDPGSDWDGYRIGELRLQLALATGDRETALEQIDWLLHFGHRDAARLGDYRALHAVIGLDEDDARPLASYNASLSQLYGADRVQRVMQWLSGESLPWPDGALEGFDLHGRLLDTYGYLQRAKQRWMEEAAA